MTVQGGKLALAPVLWRLLSGSIRVDGFLPPAAGPAGPWIFACLHADFLPALIHVRPLRPVLLVSDSPDGEILVRSLARGGYGFVRGATGQDGGRAFRELCRALDAGRCVGLAVDGPQGPYGVVHDGVLQLARHAGAAILPLRARTAWGLRLRNWDRTLVPLPLARVRIEAASPVHVPRQGEADAIQHARAALQEFFAGKAGDHARA